jgi:hypothetical protein
MIDNNYYQRNTSTPRGFVGPGEKLYLGAPDELSILLPGLKKSKTK